MCQTACLDQTRLPEAVNSPAFCSRRQTSFKLQRSRPIQEKIRWTTRACSAFGSNRARPPPSRTGTYRYPRSTGHDIHGATLCGMPLTTPTTLHEFGSLIFSNDALHLEQQVVFRALEA